MAKPGSLRARLRRHPLIDLLFTLQGNPRTCVFIEPLWGIPHSLIAPFTAVYMRALGVDNIQIGLALSAALLAQVFWAFLGGVITDKLGRKTTTILGDLLGWVVPCAIWALAQNYWFLLAAMMLNAFEQLNQTAWVCLLVEDAEEKTILNIWNWILIAGLLAVFFSPISGALIQRHSLVPVMRILYGSFALAMMVKCLITARWTTETRQGKIRKAETKGRGIGKLVAEYWHLIPRIFRNRGTVTTLVVMVVVNITLMVSGNFYALYATAGLGIPENYLAYFPMIRACVMLLFFGIQHNLVKYRTKAPMSAGLILYMLSQGLLMASPKNTIFPLILYTLLDAVAFGLVYPRKELMMAVFVDKRERARIMALLTTLMIAISSPFGGVAGALSKVDGRLPFALNLALYLLALAVILAMKEDPGAQEEEPPAQERVPAA